MLLCCWKNQYLILVLIKVLTGTNVQWKCPSILYSIAKLLLFFFAHLDKPCVQSSIVWTGYLNIGIFWMNGLPSWLHQMNTASWFEVCHVVYLLNRHIPKASPRSTSKKWRQRTLVFSSWMEDGLVRGRLQPRHGMAKLNTSKFMPVEKLGYCIKLIMLRNSCNIVRCQAVSRTGSGHCHTRLVVPEFQW